VDPASPAPTTITALLDRHDGVLLDAYGVLVDASGILPGAAALIAERRPVMIGDQLETDIAGARAAGIDCALLSGVSRWPADGATSGIAPNYLLATIEP
jgi:ribonucleotide monophosphatase NagD (HAD superfamily)